MWGSFVGDSIERQSLKFSFLEECIDGGEYLSSWPNYCDLTHVSRENVFVAGTYQKILADIAATALADADIRLSEEVIFFDAPKWRQAQPVHDPQVTLHTRKGRRESFDEVVITTPLGWLKRHKDDAFPDASPLPPRLLRPSTTPATADWKKST